MKYYILILFLAFCAIELEAQSPSVGNINLTPSVGPLGNAQLSTGIYCPPGRLGIKPSISINYNSSQANGDLGTGYSLGGISAISRAGRNFHLDNRTQQSISFTTADNIMLDGERLILISGQNLTAGSVYRTENDQFVRVTFTGSHFIVETKDGGRVFYGSTTDSKFVPHNSTQPISWYITFSFDKMGNYIRYKYLNSNAQINILTIEYSGFDCTFNNTVSCPLSKENPFHKIEFTYAETPFNEERFIYNGTFINKTRILEKIEVFSNTTRVRQYDFTYTQLSTHWLLNEIVEKNRLGESLQPIQLTWIEDGGRSVQRGLIHTSVNHFKTIGDFDGDGKKDVLIIDGELDPINNKFIDWNPYRILKYSDNPVGSIINSTPLASGVAPGSAIAGVVVADLNADGTDDILFMNRTQIDRSSITDDGGLWCSEYTKYYLNSVTYAFHAVLMHKQNNGGLNQLEVLNYYAPRTFNNLNADEHVSSLLQTVMYVAIIPTIADIDGDGLPDLILQQANAKRIVTDNCGGHIQHTELEHGDKNIFYIRLSSRRNLANENAKYISTGVLPKSYFRITDINGNGRAELFNTYAWNNTTEVYEYDNKTNSWDHIYGQNASAHFPTYSSHKWLQTADFNGDGKTDLLYFAGNNWHVAYSTGNGFIEHNATIKWFGHSMNDENVGGASNFYIDIGDFNGDGKADIIEKHYRPNITYSDLGHSGDACIIYYSIGNSFYKDYIGENPRTPDNLLYDNDPKHLCADFDGDGKTDILMARYFGSNQNQNIAVETIRKRNYKIAEARISDLHSYTFTYSYITQTNRYAQTEVGRRRSMAQLLTIPLAVVTEMREKTTGYRDEILQYHYRNLLYHTHGRGIMGFERTATVHMDTTGVNRTTLNTFEQNMEQPHILNIATTDVFNNCTNLNAPFTTATQQISKSTFEYAQKQTTPTNKTIFIHLSTQVDIDMLKGVKRTTCYEYDVNGNLIHTTSQFAKNNASAVDEYIESTDNLYALHGSWLPSSLTISRTATERYKGQPAYIVQKEFIYNNRGLLTATESFKNTPHYYLKEVFTYDQYGNVTFKGYDIANNTSPDLFRTETYTYTQGRFLHTKTNVLGHTTVYNFEPIYGNNTYIKTSDGKETIMHYDAWGRLTTTFSPDNTVEYRSLAYENSFPGAYTKMTVSNNLGNEQITYLDAKGRKIEMRSRGFNGMIQAQQWGYTTRGLLMYETNTHNPQQASTKTFSYHFYDAYNRLIRTNYNNLFNTHQIAYNGLQTTETHANGEVKTTLLDATGTVHQVTDNDGTITYTYGSQGKPVSITSTTGQTITLRYNAQGQKIEMIDPNAGTTLYDYNAFGEIIGQQDALGNNTTFEYDEVGRVIKKTVGDYVFEYTFHNQNNHVANNTLTDEKCTLSGTLKHRIQYAYNNKGLLQQTTETLPQQSKTAVTTYTYDSYDRPFTTTYPNIGLQYVYDNYGYMYEIKNSTGTTLWKLNAVNAQGLPTQILYGNGQLTSNHYDVHSRLQSILSVKGSTHALNMSYVFNLQTGNLMQRQYNNLNKLEDFNYDNMNRLTTIDKRHTTGNILIDATATEYDAGGNIKAINNGLAQDLAYNTNRPNAVFNHKFETSYSPVFVPTGSTDEHTYTFNSLGKPAELNQQNLKYTIAYGLGEQRVHTKLENNNNLIYETYYLNSASMEIIGNREITYLHAGGTPFAIHEKNGNDEQLYYLHLDYQGSIRAITDEAGAVVENRDYDAWGRPRNPNTLEYTATNPFSVSTITNRGYTFHEHIFEFSLINMNARMYDPVLRRVISPDNYIQAPDNTQSFNRYSYCWNNPLKYTDPDGNFVASTLSAVFCPVLLPVAIYFDFFTETGYDIQKYVSPVALHVDVNFSTHKSGIGVDASVGIPQISMLSARVHGGVSYYWENYGVTPGWETRYGAEIGLTPYIVVGTTFYNSPGDKFDQQIGHMRLGLPGLNIKYANDWFFGLPLGDNGDRYRTAAAKIQIGPLDIGINLFTGDPGLNDDDRAILDNTYVQNNKGDNPDEFRFGVGYIGIGGFRFGNDTEARRNKIQNEIIHKQVSHSPYFKKLNRPNKWYFGYIGGGSLW